MNLITCYDLTCWDALNGLTVSRDNNILPTHSLFL